MGKRMLEKIIYKAETVFFNTLGNLCVIKLI